jgi:hypothetical protein
VAWLSGPACMVMPIGGSRDPAPELRKGVHPGVGITAAPSLSGDGFGPEEGFRLMSECDLWLDFGVDEESGQPRDYRLRLTLLSEIPVGADDRYPFFWMPGIGIESKHLNDSGSSALVIGATTWLLFLNKCGGGCEQNDYSMFPIPYTGLWIEGLFAFGEPGDPRLLLSFKLAPAFVAVLGGHAGISAGGDLPLGGGVSLRPEISAQCFLVYTYLGEDGLDYKGYACGVSGGVSGGIGVQF